MFDLFVLCICLWFVGFDLGLVFVVLLAVVFVFLRGVGLMCGV